MKRQFILAPILFISSITLSATNSVPDDDKSDNKNKAEVSLVVKVAWEFCSTIKQPSAETLANVTNYKFGQEADYLYSQFVSIYVVRKEVVPGDSIRHIVIRKSTIYNTVRSIEKQLNRELKNNEVGQEQVTAEFTNVLKITISTFDSEAKSFKDALQQNRRNVAALLSVFQNVKLTDI